MNPICTVTNINESKENESQQQESPFQSLPNDLKHRVLHLVEREPLIAKPKLYTHNKKHEGQISQLCKDYNDFFTEQLERLIEKATSLSPQDQAKIASISAPIKKRALEIFFKSGDKDALNLLMKIAAAEKTEERMEKMLKAIAPLSQKEKQQILDVAFNVIFLPQSNFLLLPLTFSSKTGK